MQTLKDQLHSVREAMMELRTRENILEWAISHAERMTNGVSTSQG